jgi:hypothetical protein
MAREASEPADLRTGVATEGIEDAGYMSAPRQRTEKKAPTDVVGAATRPLGE